MNHLLAQSATALLLLLVPCAPAVGQVKGEPIVIGTRTSIHSTILRERRPLWIRLPADYARATGQRYPVIYLLDGDDQFVEVAGMVHRLAGNARMPDAIVVGIPNTTDRTRDLTPHEGTDITHFPMFGDGSRDSTSTRFATSGGADAMLGFLTRELTPWVESHYRTAPFRILIGHSFGGLLVLEALATRPDCFNAFVSLSPSLWWDRGRYVKALEKRLQPAGLGGRSLYMTTGGSELRAMIDPAMDLSHTMEAQHIANFRFVYRVMPGERHDTNPHRSTYDALESIFTGFEPPDSLVAALALRGDSLPLVAHYAAMSQRLGFAAPIPFQYLDGYATWILEEGASPEYAVRLFRFEAAHAPTSAPARDGLARALAKAGRRTEAVRIAGEAVRLAASTRDPHLSEFRKHRAEILRQEGESCGARCVP